MVNASPPSLSEPNIVQNSRSECREINLALTADCQRRAFYRKNIPGTRSGTSLVKSAPLPTGDCCCVGQRPVCARISSNSPDVQRASRRIEFGSSTCSQLGDTAAWEIERPFVWMKNYRRAHEPLGP